MNYSFNRTRRLLCLSTLIAPLLSTKRLFALPQPALKLSQTYTDELNLADFLVSEKFDGVRAYWTGHTLLTRAGNPIVPPHWWSISLSNIALDGELWIQRGAFSELNGLLKRSKITDEQWRRVKYVVFDLPTSSDTFEQRYASLVGLVDQMSSPNIQIARQRSYSRHKELMQELDKIIKGGGEGLMLQAKKSFYTSGRNAGLYKLKRWQDAEAVVIGSTNGRGKYLGVMGALIVKTTDGTQFRIGSGFTDAERTNPPKIGAVITYKYAGKSKKGVPRFASFLRVREHQ